MANRRTIDFEPYEAQAILDVLRDAQLALQEFGSLALDARVSSLGNMVRDRLYADYVSPEDRSQEDDEKEKPR